MMIAVDLALALGLTLRLSRLVTTDDLGLWWVRGPAAMWAMWHEPEGDGWRAKLQSGLGCPFCIGFWIGAAVLASLALVGGPGDAAEIWRWVAGTFTLSYIVGHLSSRVD